MKKIRPQKQVSKVAAPPSMQPLCEPLDTLNGVTIAKQVLDDLIERQRERLNAMKHEMELTIQVRKSRDLVPVVNRINHICAVESNDKGSGILGLLRRGAFRDRAGVDVQAQETQTVEIEVGLLRLIAEFLSGEVKGRYRPTKKAHLTADPDYVRARLKYYEWLVEESMTSPMLASSLCLQLRKYFPEQELPTDSKAKRPISNAAKFFVRSEMGCISDCQLKEALRSQESKARKKK